LALKKLKNENINSDDEDKYLTRSFFGNSFLGLSMIDISSAKNKIRKIQDKYAKLSCNKSLIDDLN
jgi:hypothetical protein